MRSARAALNFLTRIRIPGSTANRNTMGFSLLWYPIVGSFVGALCSLIERWGFRRFWPPPVSLLLLLCLLVWIKDAFHLDGLSDLVDALYGADSSKEVSTIMKDPALGPFGGLSILFVLTIEYASLNSIPTTGIFPVMSGVIGLSTSSAALLLCWGRPLEDTGSLAALLMERRRVWFGPVVIVLAFGVATLFLGYVGIYLSCITVSLSLGLWFWYENRLGGINGDCCGATAMIVQVVLLLAVSSVEHLGILSISGGILPR